MQTYSSHTNRNETAEKEKSEHGAHRPPAARGGLTKGKGIEKSLIVFLSDLGDMLVVSAPKDSRVANILIISGTQRKRRGRKKEERKGEASAAGRRPSGPVLTDEWSRHDLSGDRSAVADATESEDKDTRGHRR